MDKAERGLRHRRLLAYGLNFETGLPIVGDGKLVLFCNLTVSLPEIGKSTNFSFLGKKAADYWQSTAVLQRK